MGNLLDSFVVAANSHDGTTAARKWEGLAWQNPLLDEVEKIFADGSYRGTFSKQMPERYGISTVGRTYLCFQLSLSEKVQFLNKT